MYIYIYIYIYIYVQTDRQTYWCGFIEQSTLLKFEVDEIFVVEHGKTKGIAGAETEEDVSIKVST